MAFGKNHRGTRACQIDNRRCSKCKKVAKDKIDNVYLCRIHSPMREGFTRTQTKQEASKCN